MEDQQREVEEEVEEHLQSSAVEVVEVSLFLAVEEEVNHHEMAVVVEVHQ